MTRTAKLYLHDAIEAAHDILRFTKDRTAEDYEIDDQLRAAVERKFEIMGEALRNLRQLDSSLAETIPDLPRAVAFRNILIHGYATILNATVWSTVQENLPSLLASLQATAQTT